jgi:integrase
MRALPERRMSGRVAECMITPGLRDGPVVAKAVGIETHIGNHAFRATGITIYLLNGGTLEKAQQMAAHESPKTTKLYDRTNDALSLDEGERVVL